MRKLLPYEHQLIESLGISKEEYLEFVAIQQEYKDPKTGTVFDVTNALAPVAASVVVGASAAKATTTAIALTVVGVLFQVGAALLAPKPEIPKLRDRQRRDRQQRFAPTFGFNSTQELASYGDPINLVYTNENALGDVRVAGSLVWSSIENFGSTQFMQLILALGASKIKGIDFTKTAFGQAGMIDLDKQSVFIFSKSAGADGVPLYKSIVSGLGSKDFFPERLKPTSGDNPACMIAVNGNKHKGFSQAYTPSTSTSLGVFDAIPINVLVKTRDKDGDRKEANIAIEMRSDQKNNNKWRNRSGSFNEDDQIQLFFDNLKEGSGDKQPRRSARDRRRQICDALDFGSTYMLGTAKFRLLSYETSARNIDQGEVFVNFKCIEAGQIPSTAYGLEEPRRENKELRKEYEEARRILADPRTEENVRKEAINITNQTDPFVNIVFSGTETVDWTDEIGNKQSETIAKSGSIEYSKQLLNDFLAEKPTLDAKALIAEINKDLDLARAEIDDILNGEYDEEFNGKETQLSRDIDAVLKEDRTNGKIKNINTRIMNIKNKRKPNLNKITPKNRLKDSAFVNDDGGTKPQKNVLSRATSSGFKEVQNFEDLLDDLREKREKRRNKLIGKARNVYVRQLQSSSSKPFTGLSGNYYGTGGIRRMERRLKQLPEEGQVTDRVGTRTVRQAWKALIKEKEKALDEVTDVLENWEEYQQAFDNTFFAKCLVKAETASYDTLSLCNVVKFSLKTRLFRRISGRQKKYGERKEEQYSASDNGVKSRMVFFRLIFSETGDAEEVVPYVFAIRHGSNADFYTQLSFYNKTQKKWKFRFEPVFDITAEYKQRAFTKFAFLENSDTVVTLSHKGSTFSWYGRQVNADSTRGYYPDEAERGPIQTNEWDMFSVNSDTQIQFSFESGPEIALTAVTEQQTNASLPPGQGIDDKYSNMTMMALGVFAGRGIQDLRSISTLVTEGKACRKVENPSAAPSSSSSYAPDIFVDTVLDPDNGIGKYVDVVNVDTTSLTLAKSFCKNNNLPLQGGGHNLQFFMDGIIADVGSWREFWVNNAPFSLLELARKNGVDTLVPALPCDSSGKAADNNGLPVEVTISALFTTGNILEDSYKEEFLNYGTATEDLIASIIYRKYEATEIFSTKATVDVSLKGIDTDAAVRETFDLSQFVTQKEQAIMFGKLLCNQRRHIRKGIEFKTFPSEAVIAPGDFVFVDIGLEDWDRYSAGMVMNDGYLNTPLSDAPIDGTYEFLLYKPDTGEVVKKSSVSVTNNDTTLNGFAGYMFVMGISKPQKRVYRVTEIAIEEEGEVAIKALEYPCFVESGRLCAEIADFRASNFEVS